MWIWIWEWEMGMGVVIRGARGARARALCVASCLLRRSVRE